LASVQGLLLAGSDTSQYRLTLKLSLQYINILSFARANAEKLCFLPRFFPVKADIER
jgi:hypothetical protein